MPSLKEVRIRIASIESTQQITSAMKMVAASKLRRAQNAIVQMRPYAKGLSSILENLSQGSKHNGLSGYFEQREVKKALLIVLSSNRGLCGAFNTNVIRTTNNLISEEYAPLYKSGNLSLITIGKKVTEYYSKHNHHIEAVYDHIWDNPTFELASELAQKLIKMYMDGEYDRIELIYNHFKNAAVYQVGREQFLPVIPSGEISEEEKTTESDYIFEPDRNTIFIDLIPKSLKTQIFKVILDSNAAENGARMTAMHQATDNAKELLKDLNLAYNKARQAAITKELLEIVGGAEALRG